MKSTIVLLCIMFMITISKKGQGQSPPKKSAAQTTPKNQDAKTNRPGTNILMDEKNRQVNIFDMYDPGVIKKRGVTNTPAGGTAIVGSKSNKTDSTPDKKIITDTSKNKQADLRNKPQRN